MNATSSTAGTERVVSLDHHDLEFVRDVLHRNGVDETNRPVIFGSRATGGAGRYSDLDIGFADEPISSHALARIEEELEESDLPINVDVLNLTHASEQLREHALRGAIPLDLAVGVAA